MPQKNCQGDSHYYTVCDCRLSEILKVLADVTKALSHYYDAAKTNVHINAPGCRWRDPGVEELITKAQNFQLNNQKGEKS